MNETNIQSSRQNKLGARIKGCIIRDKEQILWVYGVVHIGCILFKAITYLQSAYRLKGEDAVEADDITEIAGV